MRPGVQQFADGRQAHPGLQPRAPDRAGAADQVQAGLAPRDAHVQGPGALFLGRQPGLGDAAYRRLNVAVTRARQKLIVVSTIRARDIALMNRAWESPDSLPTLREIYNPEEWINRIAYLPI